MCRTCHTQIYDPYQEVATAWFYLGEARKRLGHGESAITAHERALAVEPALDRAYLALGRSLLDQGDRPRAISVWQHGIRVARRPGGIEAALAELEADGEVAKPGL